MERDFAGARLSEIDYLQLAKLFRGDPKFPANYLGWLSLVDEGVRLAQAEGSAWSELVVDVNDFVFWCNRVSVHPCFDSLRAYLIVTRRGRDAAGRSESSAEERDPRRSPQRGSRGDNAGRSTLAYWRRHLVRHRRPAAITLSRSNRAKLPANVESSPARSTGRAPRRCYRCCADVSQWDTRGTGTST